jgi:hypothetical protein
MRQSVFPKAAPYKSAAQKCTPLIRSDDACNWSVDHGMRARAGRRGAVFVVVVMSALATVLAAYYGWQYGLLVTDGVTTRILAIKVERQAQVGKNLFGDPYRYFADYAFADGRGRRRTGRQSIDRGLYEALAGGRYAPAIDVRYSRSLPGVNTIDLRALRTAFSVLSVLAVIGWAAVAVGFVRRRASPDNGELSGPRATRRARRAAATSPAPTDR